MVIRFGSSLKTFPPRKTPEQGTLKIAQRCAPPAWESEAGTKLVFPLPTATNTADPYLASFTWAMGVVLGSIPSVNGTQSHLSTHSFTYPFTPLTSICGESSVFLAYGEDPLFPVVSPRGPAPSAVIVVQ